MNHLIKQEQNRSTHGRLFPKGLKKLACSAERENGRMKFKAFALYLSCAVMILALQMFQGFSYIDIGIYMSGYQHFIDEPWTSAYLGQWFLSYQLSAWLCKLFAINSFMGLRLMRLILVVIMQTLVFLSLRRRIATSHIIMGLSLVTLSQFGGYSEINYNDYSAFLLLLIILAYHRATSTSIFLAGLLAGIAVFFRLVNLSFFLLPLWATLFKLSFRKGEPHQLDTGKENSSCCSVLHSSVHDFAFYLIGTGVGIGVVAAISWFNGSLGVLMLTIGDLLHIGSDASDPHSLRGVLAIYYGVVKEEISQALILGLMLYLIIKTPKVIGKLTWGILMLVNVYLWEPASNLTVGLCFLASGLVVYRRTQGTTRLATGQQTTEDFLLLAMFMPLALPLGSNADAGFYGQCLCFLTLPLAIEIFLGHKKHVPLLSSQVSSGSTPFCVFYISLAVALLFTNVKRPMMEDGNRLQCRYTIESPLTGPILTTKENAGRHNYLLSQLNHQMPEGCYLVNNVSVPLISLLNCRPWAVFTDIFCTTSMISHYVEVAHQHSHNLPYRLTDTQHQTEGYTHLTNLLNRLAPYETIWTDGRYELQRPVSSSTQEIKNPKTPSPL